MCITIEQILTFVNKQSNIQRTYGADACYGVSEVVVVRMALDSDAVQLHQQSVVVIDPLDLGEGQEVKGVWSESVVFPEKIKN